VEAGFGPPVPRGGSSERPHGPDIGTISALGERSEAARGIWIAERSGSPNSTLAAVARGQTYPSCD
jgi:hypothetical protein